MILQQDRLTVTVAGINIYHEGTLYDTDPYKIARGEMVPLPKLVFDPDAAVGLDNIPSMRRDNTPRPTSHGVFSENGFTEGRVISLTGHALASDPLELQKLRNTLASRLNTGSLIKIEVNRSDPSEYRQTQGYLEGSLDWTKVLDNYAQWKFDILCPDPRLYGREKMVEIWTSDNSSDGLAYTITYPLQYSRSVTPKASDVFRNYGNSPAYLRLEVTGPFTSGFVIKDNSSIVRKISYTGEIPENSKLIVDTFKGVVTTTSTPIRDRSFLLKDRDWFTIPASQDGGTTPGTLKLNIDYINNTSSNGAVADYLEDNLIMKAYYRDTWI